MFLKYLINKLKISTIEWIIVILLTLKLFKLLKVSNYNIRVLQTFQVTAIIWNYTTKTYTTHWPRGVMFNKMKLFEHFYFEIFQKFLTSELKYYYYGTHNVSNTFWTVMWFVNCFIRAILFSGVFWEGVFGRSHLSGQ